MKKTIETLCITVGTFLTVYGLFNFSVGPAQRLYIGSRRRLPESIEIKIPYYYYEDNMEIVIAVGATLIVIGCLIRYWKKTPGIE